MRRLAVPPDEFAAALAPPRRTATFRPVTLAAKQQQLLDHLALIDDPQERLATIVDRAKKIAPLAENERTEANRVRGCVSLVHLVGEVREGRCRFRAGADSPLVRGLVSLLCDFYSGATPAEIVASTADPLEVLGVARNLSPTRRNGLASTCAAIRAFAEKSV